MLRADYFHGHSRERPRCVFKHQSMAVGEDIQEHKHDEDRQVQSAIEHLVATGVMPKTRIDNFDTFCNVVLAYESRLQESQHDAQCPVRSHAQAGESSDSEAAASPRTSEQSEDAETVDEDIEYPPGHESFENVTCFCGKPFAGRPMIECSSCLIWLHMSCAKVRPSNVPDVWTCQTCKEINPRKRARLSRGSDSLSSLPSPS
ncbi:PHD finger protein 23B-like [Sycon ciliatum]|uniref:PHD finger protein 23B-like n=1 Tax=Sycon ciliatum TaxID=27933 RepID=UPI0031F5F8ED